MYSSQWRAETLAPGIAKMQMEGESLPWRDSNPKINLLFPHVAGTILSNLEIFTAWSFSILQMQLSTWENLPPLKQMRQAARKTSSPEFHLALFPVCILGWKAFKVDRSFAHFLQVELRGKASDGTACTQLSRAVLRTKIIEISVPAKPDLMLILQHAVLPASVLAAFTEGGWLYRLITVCSLVMKQLPDIRHECNVLIHCQVCHAQDNHVQEIQESGFIFKLIFV